MQLFQKKTPFCSAVIVAAGSARRMQGIDKIMAPLNGKPLIWHTVRAFQEHPDIREILIVTRADLLTEIGQLCRASEFTKVTAVLVGGETRVDSVLAGVSNVSRKAKLIAVHDGARPLVSAGIISETVKCAAKTGASAPAIPVKDTVKTAKNGVVTGTPDRSTLFAVQTPQIFDADLLRAALENARKKQLAVTDDCSAVEAMGMRVTLTEGEERNLKITTPMDLSVAKLWMEEAQ